MVLGMLYFFLMIFISEFGFFPSCHPWLPLVATSSGQRHVTHLDSGSDSDSDSDTLTPSQLKENSVKLWWTGDRTELDKGIIN